MRATYVHARPREQMEYQWTTTITISSENSSRSWRGSPQRWRKSPSTPTDMPPISGGKSYVIMAGRFRGLILGSQEVYGARGRQEDLVVRALLGRGSVEVRVTIRERTFHSQSGNIYPALDLQHTNKDETFDYFVVNIL